MKRVNAITRCKGVINELLDRKANRILRQVHQAIDAAKDKVSDLEEKKEAIIAKLGGVAGAEQTGALQGKLNEYIDVCNEIEDYKRSIKHLEDLRDNLNEEVEISEQEDGSTVIVKKSEEEKKTGRPKKQ